MVQVPYIWVLSVFLEWNSVAVENVSCAASNVSQQHTNNPLLRVLRHTIVVVDAVEKYQGMNNTVVHRSHGLTFKQLLAFAAFQYTGTARVVLVSGRHTSIMNFLSVSNNLLLLLVVVVLYFFLTIMI